MRLGQHTSAKFMSQDLKDTVIHTQTRLDLSEWRCTHPSEQQLAPFLTQHGSSHHHQNSLNLRCHGTFFAEIPTNCIYYFTKIRTNKRAGEIISLFLIYVKLFSLTCIVSQIEISGFLDFVQWNTPTLYNQECSAKSVFMELFIERNTALCNENSCENSKVPN